MAFGANSFWLFEKLFKGLVEKLFKGLVEKLFKGLFEKLFKRLVEKLFKGLFEKLFKYLGTITSNKVRGLPPSSLRDFTSNFLSYSSRSHPVTL